MKKFIKSCWAYTYRRADSFALFNSRNLEVFFVDRETTDLLSFFNKPRETSEVFNYWQTKKNHINKNQLKNTINTLIKTNFIVDDKRNELKELKEWVIRETKNKESALSHSLKLKALRVILTEKCNMNCSYCFVKNKKIKASDEMSLGTLINGIHLLKSLNKKGYIEVHFFGGEPLIKFDLIVKAVDYMKRLVQDKQIKKIYYGITTNGTLITDKIAQFLKKNNFLVSISIDGWKSLHNLNRYFYDGRGSFDNALRGLKILQKNKNDVGILITPTQNNIEFLAQACEYIISKLKCRFITINTPQPVKGNWNIDGRMFSKEVQKCFEIAKKHKAIINSFGTRALYAINNKRPLILSCSQFGGHYTATLTSDGKISPCIVSWDYRASLTPVTQFQYLGKFSKWKLTPPYFFKKCLNCPAMNVCGGPCPLEIYEMKKFSKPIDHERCKFFKDIVKWAVWFED